jgi:hypothetical protein
MGFWWRLRQWVYARPPIVAAGAILLFLLVGFSGWESARWFSEDGVTKATSTVLYRVTATKTLRVKGKNVPVINHFITRTRPARRPNQRVAVVVTKDVTRVVPTTQIRNDRITLEARPVMSAKTVTNVQTQTVVKTHTLTQLINNTQTVTQTQTQPAPTEGPTRIPPGHSRPTNTVTVIQTQTVTQAATVTVTAPKGH